MPACLTPQQIDDLLATGFDWGDESACAAHLDECADCSVLFEQRSAIADVENWRLAALEWAAPSREDSALLESLKREPQTHDVKRTDYGALYHGGLVNGQLEPRIMKMAAAKTRLPEVPGFEIAAELGRGGMGIVYRARQPAHDRTVALKMILAGRQASVEDLGRFHDEAEAISRLRHPNIVQIFEVGQHDGRLYFVLEFVEGGTLADKINDKPLPARSSAQLLEALARAMYYAHQRGIIHRDLKPANVLLHSRKAFLDAPDAEQTSEDWDFRRYMPKITDFGLAKLLDRNAVNGHTASGDVVGTPNYMAPEQAQGKPYPIAATTDVYSLGAILYEMITGRPPFQGETPMDTLLKVHSEQPVRPRKIVRDIPAALEAICLKCLRKQPSRRYRSSEELAEDLRLFLAGRPIRSRGLHPVWRRWDDARDQLGQWLMAALVFLLSIVAGGLLIGLWKLERPRSNVAVTSNESLARENATLRLRLAQLNCERGDIAQGLAEMATLLAQTEREPALQPLHNAVAGNVAMWLPYTPNLIFVVPERVATATLLSRAEGVEVAGRTDDGKLVRWLIPAGKLPRKLGSEEPPGTEPAVDPAPTVAVPSTLPARLSGSTVVAAGAGVVLTGGDRSARLWSADGELMAVLPHPAPIEQVAFATDKQTFLTRDVLGTVRIWTRPTGIESIALAFFPGVAARPRQTALRVVSPPYLPRLVASSPAGEQRLTLDENGTPRLWLAGGGVEPLCAPGEWICGSFSRDGRWLLTGWSDGVRLWDAATGRQIGPAIGFPNAADLAFVQSDTSILAWSASSVQLWQLPLCAPLAANDLRNQVQVQTGLERAADGSLRFLDTAEWQQRQTP
jgi:eukaryotic-like serine/threonine-protein kinase